MVKEAQTGSDAMLLLERIEESEIHPGDHLLPGQKDDLRLTDEEGWEKWPERIQPILHFRQFLGKIAMLAIYGVFMAFGLIPLMAALNTPEGPVFAVFGFLVVWYGVCGYLTYRTIKALIKGLQGRKQFMEGQSQTIAQILRRKVVEHESKYGTTFTFHFQMEFTPTLAAINIGTLKLEAEVSKKLYESLWGVKTVNVTYATEDPHIFILEGE